MTHNNTNTTAIDYPNGCRQALPNDDHESIITKKTATQMLIEEVALLEQYNDMFKSGNRTHQVSLILDRHLLLDSNFTFDADAYPVMQALGEALDGVIHLMIKARIVSLKSALSKLQLQELSKSIAA